MQKGHYLRIFFFFLALLMHQAEMASFLSLIYSAQIGVEVEEGGVQRRVQPTPAATLQATNDAEAAMAYCREEILPQLVKKNGCIFYNKR